MNMIDTLMTNEALIGRRVQCLYRVSTEQQVTYNDKKQPDIPMQRKSCHKFSDQMDWVIVFEDQEEGISGHKVRAENRDKIQLIKERAKKKLFDILLVFMFDRIGRIADETPFVVEWFVKNGIRVWSTEEGEQRFESHTDKLTNYIRFWQADGESEKTSIRTSVSMGQLIEDGFYTGGTCPYGYRLVNKGRKNKRGQDVLDPEINVEEAAVVKIIFYKYVFEGYGSQRIATYLREQGIKNRSGKNWHEASIRNILCNPAYTGILRSGNSVSKVLPYLIIIDGETFDMAQKIREERNKKAAERKGVPLNTKGQSLLAGNVYCGHCGSRLNLTTNGKYDKRADGSTSTTKRIRYTCYGKTRKVTDCDGQTGYTMHILDGIIESMILRIFRQMSTVSKQEIIESRFQEKIAERQAILRKAKSEYTKVYQELETLKNEVIKAIHGESAFTPKLLGGMIEEAEQKCEEAKMAYGEAQTQLDSEQAMWNELANSYNDIITWSEMYDSAGIEAKKMIVASLIERIDVFRDYKVRIKFSIAAEQFLRGLNIAA